jgi:protein TonB
MVGQPPVGVGGRVFPAAARSAVVAAFQFPDASRTVRERALDVVLVNRRSARAPEEATVQAQANLDSGGNTEHERRAKTPMPAAPRQQQGDELEHSQKRIQALEAHQQRLAAQAQSRDSVSPTTATGGTAGSRAECQWP